MTGGIHPVRQDSKSDRRETVKRQPGRTSWGSQSAKERENQQKRQEREETFRETRGISSYRLIETNFLSNEQLKTNVFTESFESIRRIRNATLASPGLLVGCKTLVNSLNSQRMNAPLKLSTSNAVFNCPTFR